MSRKLYKYGMRLRGFAPMCQPLDGLARWHEDGEGKYHTILYYKRKLSVREEAMYELDYLGEEYSSEYCGRPYKLGDEPDEQNMVADEPQIFYDPNPTSTM